MEGPESIYLEDSFTLLINLSHPTAKYVIRNISSTSKEGGLKYHICKCATNELLRLYVKRRVEGIRVDEVSPSTVETIMEEVFDMKQRFSAKWATLFMSK